jgi:glycosyltransferase involved in cell wall biosynthesis
LRDASGRSSVAARRLRVCLLLETFHPVVGGGETQGRLLADGLAERGFEVLVVTRRSCPELARRERLGALDVHRAGPVGPGQLRKWALVLTVLPALLRLRRRYDVLLVAGFRILGIPALALGSVLGTPCVLKAESNGEMSGAYFAAGLASRGLGASSPLFRAFLGARNRLFRRAAAFVAISSEIRQELLDAGIEGHKIASLPNGVDTDIFRPAARAEQRELRRELGLPEDDRVFVYTGRLVRYKGLPLLLRAWRELAARRTGIRLLLVGSGGADMHNCEAELKEYVRANDLSEGVVFTGAVDSVHRYLQAADAFVFPTEDEAFGISLIEAMACGLPAVTTSTGGIRDIARDGENALVVEPGCLETLVAAMETLLDDRTLAERLGRAALRTVTERYAREAVVSRYAELLQGLERSS